MKTKVQIQILNVNVNFNFIFFLFVIFFYFTSPSHVKIKKPNELTLGLPFETFKILSSSVVYSGLYVNFLYF